MKVRNSKSEIQNRFEIRIVTDLFSKFAPKFVAQVRWFDLNAAENSRTLPQARDWRVLLHAIQSARFWSAAVLCRFLRGQGFNRAHFRLSEFGLRVCFEFRSSIFGFRHGSNFLPS
jgi:hypothetical protein